MIKNKEKSGHAVKSSWTLFVKLFRKKKKGSITKRLLQ
jgi:hypothetical protein